MWIGALNWALSNKSQRKLHWRWLYDRYSGSHCRSKEHKVLDNRQTLNPT